MTIQWEQIAAKYSAHRDSTIPSFMKLKTIPYKEVLNVTNVPATCGLLSPRELELTEKYDATALADLIKERKTTSVELVTAFCKRAAVAQQLLNCVNELLFDEALEQATKLDEHYAKTGELVGPLHGIPVSVKEHICVKGHTATASFLAKAEVIAEEDADIVETIRKAGGVLFCRTPQPQSIMQLETSSNLIGVTVNPFNRKLTPGGSSGGEGALLGIRASVLGIGSDIGGSIRSPAANNGLFGYRPSTLRLSRKGCQGAVLGQESILGVVGPLAHSVRDLNLFMNTCISSKPWLNDASVVPIPWRNPDLPAKMRIGVIRSDKVVTPQPPVQRAMQMVIDKLEKSPKFELVDVEPMEHKYSWELISELYFLDGGKVYYDLFAKVGEPIEPLTEWILNQPSTKNHDMAGVWKLVTERDAYRNKYTKYLQSYGVDLILCPAGPGPAPKLGEAKYWTYTSVWNLLDLPSAVFPVTKVDPGLDVKDESYEPMNDEDAFHYQTYNPEDYKDAPVSLQLVGKRWDDENLLAALEKVVETL
ncbi:acetamidase [Schizosaccharomyces cryophilus OY26]|uniref:amidase n=1 Tax=Schizosaccharomyces cryophilus (strain OY26 / ATCC MYA-4695 / CBS 11777 / NBRC 106824 / NRRL Y48691) TaxID=653667 RepID=S9X0T9_SCHCR|nr:acetamidase [Schizosaccharomyces cryophilus OY26]EPY50597.1 acetamidase [Schizosaccharomyces cryophilus OY26]